MAGRRRTRAARSSTRSSSWSAGAARGASCPTTSRPGRRSIGTSRAGARTGRWAACTTHCASGYGAPRAALSKLTAAISDAQSAKGAATVGAASRGYDAGKKINGRKRQLVVDTIGLLLLVMVTTASVQDRDGARSVLAAMSTAYPAVSLVWADGGYAGKLVEWAQTAARIVLEIVKKPERQRGFEVLPRRWLVERRLSWITGCRRLDRDYERLPATSEAMVKWAMIGVMTRRLAPGPGRRPWSTPATT